MSMGRKAAGALLGFLVGAATFAGGEDEAELEERLAELQEAVDHALHRLPSERGLPVVSESGLALDVVGVSDLVHGIHDHYPPVHRLGFDEDSELPLFGGISEEVVAPFGTVDEIVDLLRWSVWPESWDQAQIVALRDHLFVLNRPPVLRDLRRFLDQTLRARALRCVTVEAEVADLAGTDYGALASGQAPYEALRGRALVRFACRATGIAGQRFLVWHGRQVATHLEADVEVAESAQTSDPVVGVIQAGGYLCVRPRLTDDADRVYLEAEIREDELEGAFEGAETADCGVLEMPCLAQAEARVAQLVPADRWVLIGSAAGEEGTARAMLVRARVHPWRGGDR